MAIDVDVQMACHENDLPLSGVEMAALVDLWTCTVLTSRQSSWQRPQQWLAAESLDHAVQLTVRIVDVAEAASLNQNYRQAQGITNVLSFPFAEPFQCQPPLLGDVVICASRVVEEAGQQGKQVLAHWAHLVVHGVLHLLGYDHLADEQAELMEGLEVVVLAQLGYSDPY